jgi:hypothetical protein
MVGVITNKKNIENVLLNNFEAYFCVTRGIYICTISNTDAYGLLSKTKDIQKEYKMKNAIRKIWPIIFFGGTLFFFFILYYTNEGNRLDEVKIAINIGKSILMSASIFLGLFIMIYLNDKWKKES